MHIIHWKAELVIKRPLLKGYPRIIFIFGYNLVRICENCYFQINLAILFHNALVTRQLPATQPARELKKQNTTEALSWGWLWNENSDFFDFQIQVQIHNAQPNKATMWKLLRKNSRTHVELFFWRTEKFLKVYLALLLIF